MNKITLALLIVAFTTPVFAADYVNGHYRDTNGDGYKETYVQGYTRSSPNNTTLDNYSTRGNSNPYSGQAGTVNPYSYDNASGNRSKSSQPYSYNPYRR